MKNRTAIILLAIFFLFSCALEKNSGDNTEDNTPAVYSVVIENHTSKRIQFTFDGKREELYPMDLSGYTKSYTLNYSPKKPTDYYLYVQTVDVLEEKTNETNIKYIFVDINTQDIEPLKINILVNVEGSLPYFKLSNNEYSTDNTFFGISFNGVTIDKKYDYDYDYNGDAIIIPIVEDSYSFKATMYSDYGLDVKIKGRSSYSNYYTYYNTRGSLTVESTTHYYYLMDPPPWDRNKDGKYILWQGSYGDATSYTFDVKLSSHEFINNTLTINIKFEELGLETFYGRIPPDLEHAVVNIDDFTLGEYVIQRG